MDPKLDNAKNLIQISYNQEIKRLFLNNLGIADLNNIPELLECSHLKKLTLSYNGLKDISQLENLTELENLDLNSNTLKDISVLKKLIKLKSLKLHSNQISDINVLKNLKKLENLDLRSNNISDISPLENLVNLKNLNLSQNKIKNVPKSFFSSKMKFNINGLKSEGLDLSGNAIESPPIEILKQGKSSVLDWFKAKKASLNEVKVILIGEPKAGKTSLLRRLKEDTFDENEVQTDGVNIEDIKFGKNNLFKEQLLLHEITGHFWDFGGQEIMSSTHKFFLTKRTVYILVLDARKDKEISLQIKEWVERIKSTGGESSIIVVANQIDVNTSFGFENEYEIQKEFPQVKCFLKVSCKNGENLNLLKDKLEDVLPQAELFNTEIDEKWIVLKEKLQNIINKKNFLDESQFLKICKDCDIIEKRMQKNAILFLHDLGLVLHFDEINLSEYYVLDPYWITYGVYQILTSTYAGENGGIIPMQKLDFIVNEEKDKLKIYKPTNYKKVHYTSNQRRFLVDILHQFKLSFYRKGNHQIIIPDLIETKEPIEITENIRQMDDSIQFVYEYSYLPTFIMPNLIVDNYKIIVVMWRTGCVLQNDNCKALVTSYQNRISITVIGDYKEKREFMAVIRYQLDEINKNLSEIPKELIPLPDTNSFAEYEVLLNREKKGKKNYIMDEDKPTEKEFEITKLLEGIPNQDEIKNMLNKVLLNQDKIMNKLDTHYQFLINQPQNIEIKREIEDSLSEINDKQAKKISMEITQWVTENFEVLEIMLDEKFSLIYEDLNKTNDVQMKLKLGIPFINLLGINFETEFDVKSWATKMYNKYKLQIFKSMRYV